MKFTVLNSTDTELQKALLLVALWTPEDMPNREASDLELPHIKEFYEDWGKAGDLAILALDTNDEPMGLIQIRYKSSLTQRHAELPELAIAVLPQFQGRGIGQRLFSELMARIPDSVNGMRLGVHPENQAAISLYKKFGFEFYETPKGGFPQMVRLSNPI